MPRSWMIEEIVAFESGHKAADPGVCASGSWTGVNRSEAGALVATPATAEKTATVFIITLYVIRAQSTLR